MKIWHGVVLIIAIGIIVAGVVLLLNSNDENEQSNEQSSDIQYVPKYTLNQVIDIAKAKYPNCVKGWPVDTIADTSISVSNMNNYEGIWKVEITCPSFGYRIGYTGYTSPTLYFHEDDGSFTSSLPWNPPSTITWKPKAKWYEE